MTRLLSQGSMLGFRERQKQVGEIKGMYSRRRLFAEHNAKKEMETRLNEVIALFRKNLPDSFG